MERDGNLIAFLLSMLILFLILVGVLWSGIYTIVKSYKKRQAYKLRRQTQIPIVGMSYSFQDEPQLEFTVLSFEPSTASVDGLLTVYIPISDEIRSWDTTYDLGNIKVDVKHKDGSYETLRFNAEKNEPLGLDAWNTYITKPVVIKQN